ncbi:hypothetical protein DEO23_08415 [Brachybacterium endophyticum]|uniref:WXG100 family type VII secretion target n=1 Tax=Brachybacterium endophyticum TaxID=2182385 RepID=A0A2U2RM11_9MICO|nr:hypothetical protein [Brachybacterium endophyticum]PWH06909.1 hypothetical protein DEO23_08415 [Brachybacterium endophyticum]
MTGFLGCDTARMITLAERLAGAAGRLAAQGELLTAAAGVSWEGPDAEAFREGSARARTEAASCAADLTDAAQKILVHAQEQERASSAEDSPPPSLADLAERLGTPLRDPLPWGHPEQDWGDAVRHDLFGLSDEELREIARPVPLGYRDHEEMMEAVRRTTDRAGEVVGGLVERARDLADSWGEPVRARDDEYDLDPVFEKHGSHLRHVLTAPVPYAGEVQTAMDIHGRVSDALDSVERAAQERGYGEAVAPVVSVARAHGALGEAVLGEHSVLGEAASHIDSSLGSSLQSVWETTHALGQGDLGGAAQAMENNAYRQLGIGVHALTTTPAPMLGDAASSYLGAGADVLDSPVFAGTSVNGDQLRRAQAAVDGATEIWERGRTNIADMKPALDLRKQYAPMPWDD